MHGDELKYITEAYETNWMSTVGANINSAEAEIAAKVGCKYALREKAKYDVYLGAVPLDGKNRKTSVYLILKNHSKLIEVLSRTIKDGRIISLIHKYLNAGVMEDGGFHATEEGVPQGGPLSPLLGNVMLNELDKELERRGHKFVRYADDCMIFCKSRELTMKYVSIEKYYIM